MIDGGLVSLLKTKRLWRGPLVWVLGLFVLANLVAARFEKALIAEGKRNLLLIPAPANAAPDSDKNLRTARYDVSVGRDLTTIGRQFQMPPRSRWLFSVECRRCTQSMNSNRAMKPFQS